MSRPPEEEKHMEVKKIIAGKEYIKCTVCFNFFRTEDLNRHYWSHAWDKYESLSTRRQSGRFKQLQKFVSKQYKVRETNSKNRDLEEIYQRRLFYEKYPRIDAQSSARASPVASSAKSTPTSETQSNETIAAENISNSKPLEENLEDSKENNDFDLPPLEEIPKLPERLNQFMDNSSTKSENSGLDNDLEIEDSSPKKPLTRTNSEIRPRQNNESVKPEEVLVDSAESLDLGPSELTWNTWEAKLDSEEQIYHKVLQNSPKKTVVVEGDAETQPELRLEERKGKTDEMVEPEKDLDEKMEVDTPAMTEINDQNIQSVFVVDEVDKNVSQKQAAELQSQSDIGKEFSDEDNELMIDENFGAGQEFIKFRNRSLNNDNDATASGPISDILENAAALSGVSPQSDSKTEITNDFEIEKVETLGECIEISDEDDDEPITKLIQSNRKPQTDREKLDVANGFIAKNMEKISSRVSKPIVPSGSAGPSVCQSGAQFLPYQNPTPPNSAVICKPARVDPHFDGRPRQITVGRFEKVTKSRSLDRSKNRSADRWSQEDFEKTNRMAMRELQSVKRLRNQSLPINSNESNNRPDQQTSKHSQIIHQFTRKEVNSNQTQPSPMLTYKDFIVKEDVIDIGSVQDHFELVSRGIHDNKSKEQIILIQSTDENVDVSTNGWNGIVKNPIARNQLTLTPGNSPEGSMMGLEDNHSARKISQTGKRDFDVIEINDSSDENSPQKRARIQVRNSNNHYAHENFHSATGQPPIANSRSQLNSVNNIISQMIKNDSQIQKKESTHVKNPLPSVQPPTYYTQAGTSNSTLPKYNYQPSQIPNHSQYVHHSLQEKHRRTSNGSTGSYSSDPKRNSTSSQLGHCSTVGASHQHINITGQSAYDLELQGQQNQIQQNLQDALMTQTIRAMMGRAVPPSTRQPPTQNIRPVSYHSIPNPIPSQGIQQLSMAQMQQIDPSLYMPRLAMSQHQATTHQQRSRSLQRATTMQVPGPGINIDQQAFNDFLTNREGYRRQ